MIKTYRTVVDMSNKNALITKAMLASYINEKHIDYLSMLEPFIKKSLPSLNEDIDISELTKKVNTEYGLDLKQKVIEKILIRLAKNKNGSIIGKKTLNQTEKYYYVKTSPDNESFDKRKAKMQETVYSVVEQLTSYINESNIIKKFSHEDIQKHFIDFLDKYNYDVYANAKNVPQKQQITSPLHFKIANFIISEYNKKENSCYDKIRLIQEGHFASVAIYFFSKSSEKPFSKRLTDTLVILDTRVLIDALYLNYPGDADAMEEMLLLVKNNGGRLCTYDYYVEEVKGIIYKFLTDRKSRINLDLAYFRDKKCSDTEIKLFIKTIENKLENKGIEIIELPNYDDQIEDQSWHIDPLELKQLMSSLVDYPNGEFSEAFNNDFNTLQALPYYRKNQSKKAKENCPALFVTKNNGLVHVAKKVCSKFHDDDFDLAISDLDLTSVLWLSNYNSNSKLPDLVLLENSYAALCPSKDIMDEVLRMIENDFNNSDEQIRNDAMVLRYDNSLLKDISEITQNDRDSFDNSIVLELIDRMKNRIKQETIVETQEKVANDTKLKVAAKYEKIYQDKFEELSSREKEINKRSHNAELRSKKAEIIEQNSNKQLEIIRQQQNEIACTSLQSKALENELNRIMENEKLKCSKISEYAFKMSYYSLITIFSIIMFYILYSCICMALNSVSVRISFSQKMFEIITLLGSALTFVPAFFAGRMVIRKIALKVKNKSYQYLYMKSKILNQE